VAVKIVKQIDGTHVREPRQVARLPQPGRDARTLHPPLVPLLGVCSLAMAYLFESEEHAAIRATCRKFAATHIAPKGADWEEAEEFPVELYKTAAAAGIQGIGYP